MVVNVRHFEEEAIYFYQSDEHVHEARPKDKVDSVIFPLPNPIVFSAIC